MGAFLSLPAPVAIYLAVKAGRTDEVKAIISQFYNGIPHSGCLEWKDELGDTALTIATRNGDIDLVKLLLNLGSDCSHLSEQPGGASALHEAVRSVRVSPRIIEILLKNGANPFLENDYGITPWEIALSRKQSTICRRFEQEKGLFASHLQVEISEEPREHRRRWISIIPSYMCSDQKSPVSRHLYVFLNEQSSRHRHRVDLATIKPPVVVRTQDVWKLFLGPIKKTADLSITETNLVFVFGSDKNSRKQLEIFLRALIPTKNVSLTPPPPKGKPIFPFEGMRPVSKERRRSHELTEAFKCSIKPDVIPVRRHTKNVQSRYFSGPSRASGPCVICLENPQTAGFAHGHSIHRCVCKKCALLFMDQTKQTTCPICRQNIENIITDFY
eukprot:g7096.t1